MLKKTALVLLCLNFLTPKPVTAVEPVTCVMGAMFIINGFMAYIGWTSAGVKAEKSKKDAEIKQLKAELDERKRNAHAALLDCMASEKRKSILNSVGISQDCEDYRKTWQSCKECNQ